LAKAQCDLFGGYSIRETAERCGFSGVDYFHKGFHRFTAQTPQKFREKPFAGHALLQNFDAFFRENLVLKIAFSSLMRYISEIL